MLAMSASPLPSGDCGWDGGLDCDCEVPLSPASDTILYPLWPSRCGGRTTPDRSPSRYPPTHVPRLQSAGSMSVRPPEYPPPFETRSRCCGIHGSSSTRRSGFPPPPQDERTVTQRGQRSQIRSSPRGRVQDSATRRRIGRTQVSRLAPGNGNPCSPCYLSLVNFSAN
jgi:hypothetical protein